MRDNISNDFKNIAKDVGWNFISAPLLPFVALLMSVAAAGYAKKEGEPFLKVIKDVPEFSVEFTREIVDGLVGKLRL